MTDILRELQIAFNKVSNQIEFQLQEFEAKSKIEDKYIVRIELKNLINELENYMKSVEEEYNMSPVYLKNEFKCKVKKNLNQFKFYKTEITKCEELLKNLDRKENENISITNKISNLPDIGKGNFQSLYYSQTKTIQNNAKQTFNNAKEYIKQLEIELKTTPFLEAESSSYFHYKNYNETHHLMKKTKKKRIYKRVILTLIILFIILCIAAFVYIHTLGGGHLLNFQDDTPYLNITDTSSMVNNTNNTYNTNNTN